MRHSEVLASQDGYRSSGQLKLWVELFGSSLEARKEDGAPQDKGSWSERPPASLVEGFAHRLFQSFDLVSDHQFPALQLDNAEVVRGKMHESVVQFAFQYPMFPFQFNEMRLNRHTKSPLWIQPPDSPPTSECTSAAAPVDGYRKLRRHI